MADRKYTLKPTFTPVVSQGEGEPSPTGDALDRVGSPSVPASDPGIRAENEDDDGYDPYSDRREERPLFEQNPWD